MIKANPYLASLVKRVATRIDNGTHPLVEDDVQRYVENHIDVAYPLLDTLVQINDNHALNHIDQAALVLLSEIIYFAQHQPKQEKDWALSFNNTLQAYIAKLAISGHISTTILQHIFDIFRHNDMPIYDSLRRANTALLDNCDTGITLPDITELLASIAQQSHDSPYEMYQQLMNHLQQMHHMISTEMQLLMINEMAQASLPLIRETAVLMLLHPDKNVRYYVAYILAKQPQLITSSSLRRCIILRNWLPTEEQATIDNLIKLARRHHVDCEAWPTARVIKLIAVNTQTIVAVTEQQGQYQLSSLLMKKNHGIDECVLFQGKTAQELNQAVDNIVTYSSYVCIQEGQVDKLIAHFISVGLHHKRVPSPLLLGFAERLGASHWRAEKAQMTSLPKQPENALVTYAPEPRLRQQQRPNHHRP